MSEIEPDRQVPTYESEVFQPRNSAVALVIPVINEGKRLLGQLDAIAALAPPVDIIIADGGSNDGSTDATQLEPRRVRACLTKTGPGKLSAQLRMAYAWALEQGYEAIITMDGNGKDGVDGIQRILDKLEAGFGYVQGSRYSRGGRAINTPLSRWIAGRFIHAPLVSLAARHWFTDTTNGFRGYSSAFLADPGVRPFRNIFMRYSLLFYLSVRASQLGYKVTEVGVTRTYPDSGAVPTKINGFRGKLDLLGELFGAVTRRYHPKN
ncbi:glycosyltransferase family 2 protein [Ruegeria lacuscaerulensis]|uniref:glycosyltransferase family 2 protein n=1 Tax=Ruegeria lacuscaerulensis TaxID=55218 RepID=UPI00147E865B|nr:glycosyltransferase family 2 protein [Ruegeria lacuscaerulensis]